LASLLAGASNSNSNGEKYPKCSLVLVVIRQERKKKKTNDGAQRALPPKRHRRGGKEDTAQRETDEILSLVARMSPS
jgi:hypothetical protein